ncbi:MAG: hypothetical protein HFI09_04105 [Bacilli bacterium]|nr:hypothetical protein [Bacilli bacterium]
MMKLNLQMFASGTIPGGNYNSIYSYYLNWSSVPNLLGNYSDVTGQWLYKKNASDPYNAFNTSGSSKVNIAIDGASSGNMTANYDLRNAPVGSIAIIASFTKRVYHADNGKKSVSISATHTTGTSWGTKNIASTNRDLDTIARSTTCPTLNGYIEDTYTIALNPASSNFSHSLKVSFGTIVKYINASGNLQDTEYKFTNNSINFTIPSAFYQQFNGKSGTGKLILNTYSGNTLIGTKEASLTANCLESRCKPQVAGTVIDVNSVTTALSGNANKIIKGFSNVKITPQIKASSTSGDTKSTISTKAVDGTTFSTDTVTLNKVSKKDFTLTATNSRGFPSSKVVSASGGLIEYFSPNINVEFARTSQTSSEVKLTYSGSFFNDSFGAVMNTLTVKWYWKEKNASAWTLGGTLTPNLSGNTINKSTISCGSNFDYQKDYRFKLEVVDKLSNGNKEMDVVAGIPNFSFGKNWFQHHTDVFDKNNNKFVSRNIKTLTERGHAGWPSDSIPDINFISFWNGAYGISNKSNLQYCANGEIQAVPVVLYSSNTGSSGDITLSETSANFKYIEILYHKADIYSSVKVDSPNGKQINLIIAYVANESIFQLKGKNVKISGNKITVVSEGYANLSDKQNPSIVLSNTNETMITKVLGYR